MESDPKHAIATLRAAILLNQIQEKKLRTIIACFQFSERRMQAQFDINRLTERVRADTAELNRMILGDDALERVAHMSKKLSTESMRGWTQRYMSEIGCGFKKQGGSWRTMILCGILGSGAMSLSAQSVTSRLELPNAPGDVGSSGQSSERRASVVGNSSIHGTVLDKNQGIVPDARITLVSEGNAEERVTVSDSGGQFSFANLPPGKYRFTITSPGLETFVSSEINLKAGQEHEVPLIALPIAATSIDVQVRVTERELAEEQIKAETKQRILGVIPNYYSSYIWNAAPLVPKQKLELAFRSRTDPVAFLTTAVVAGVEQEKNRFPGYGDGAEGYAKRYGAAYATSTISRFLGSAVFPSIFHQDPRYFYKGSGSVPSRAWYAMTRSVVARGDNGKWQPGYSHVLGSVAAGAISNLYHPGVDRGATLTFENALIGIGSAAAGNLVREFVLRKIVHGVPDFEQGDHRESSPKITPP